MKNVLDKFLYKVVSRKLLVFITSTVFLALGTIGADQWLTLAVAYTGVQAITDTIVRIKGSFESQQMVQKAKTIMNELKELKGEKDDLE